MKNLAFRPYPFKKLFFKSSIIFYSCKFENFFPVSFISPNVEFILGFRDQDFIENDQLWIEHIHPEDRNKVLTSYEDLKDSTKRTIDFRFKHKNGHYKWLRDEIIIQNDKDGEPESIIGTSIDITQRKKAEKELRSAKFQLQEKVHERTESLKKRKEELKEALEEKKVLLIEIHHRVKNNLAVITSLLTLQSLNTNNPTLKKILQEVITRIHSIALVHEQLYQTNIFSKISFDQYINELIDAITDTLNNNSSSIQIEKDIEPILLNINQAIPCGLILNELLTNAHKHAFTDQEKGKIYIKVQRESDNLVTMKVRDNGKGLPDSFDSSVKSLGFTIIDQLIKQLKGTLSTNFKKGSCFEIKFKMK